VREPVSAAAVFVRRLAAVLLPLIATPFIRAEWTQDAHDAQRTGASPKEPLPPWTLAWTWNGPDAQGAAGNHFYDAPREARTVTGGDFVYVPAGAQGLFALRKSDGSVGWKIAPTSFEAAPAYDAAKGCVYAGGADGHLYRIAAADGAIAGRCDLGSPLRKAVLLAGESAFAVSDDGALHAVSLSTMERRWSYEPRAPAATPASFSAARGLVVYATNDLHVHAVLAADGGLKWRVKPTPLPAGFPNEMDGGWPVIAEQHGVVFVRMRLDHESGLWSGPAEKKRYPDSCTETRAFLVANPRLKNLFALRLEDGAEAFVPAVGYGGVEALEAGKPFLDIGTLPVVRVHADGSEVACMLFRNGQRRPPDGRWDSNLGEMVLDGHTVRGLAAGDLRFVEFPNSMVRITDEQCPLTMAGDTVFHAHWGASESTRIVDRSPGLGLSFSSPIKTMGHPPVVRRIVPTRDFDPGTHWTKSGLTLFGDGRYWPGPGWWVYWNCLDPPTPRRSAYSEGLRPRYTM
jgi:hypothetical protein